MVESFKQKVYKLTQQIPQGKVATYKQLATLAGNSKAARAVGMFMKINPNAPVVPCHRVVASDGSLTGYSAVGGLTKKREMLLIEGVMFSNAKVDLKSSQWSIN